MYAKVGILILLEVCFALNVHAEEGSKLDELSIKDAVKQGAITTQAPESPKNIVPNGLITSNWSDFFNITRLQSRTTAAGRRSYTQATFVRFPSKIYIAQVYELTEKYAADPRLNYFELNAGGPLSSDPYVGKLLGWVCRDQMGTGLTYVVSCGMQYNFSDHNELSDFQKKYKFTSFIQLFPVKNNDVLGRQDIVHYYSISIYKSFYVRGYNNWYHYSSNKNYLRALQDFILPINKNFDIFLRHTYQNRNDIQYGKEGSELAGGVRFNFSL